MLHQPKFPRRDPPYQVFWCWDISYECNYRCSYCVVDFDSKIEYLSISQWKDIWDNIYYRYGSSCIRISGGEPFVYPGFIELLKALAKYHKIKISTNLSFDAKEFVENLSSSIKERHIVINPSFHPEFVKIDEFIEKILFLRCNNCHVESVSIVAWPPFLNQFSDIKKKLSMHNIETVIIALRGYFFKKQYPEEYTLDEKNIIKSLMNADSKNEERFNFELERKESLLTEETKLCRMGQNFGMIYPDGDVYRCCTKVKSNYLGNISDDNFKLLDNPDYCKLDHCVCFRAMLLGNEEEWWPKWKFE